MSQFDWKNIEFDLSKLSDATRDEIIISVSEGKLPLGRLFSLIRESGHDSEVFKSWFDELMEQIADAHPMGTVAVAAIRNVVSLIGRIGGKK